MVFQMKVKTSKKCKPCCRHRFLATQMSSCTRSHCMHMRWMHLDGRGLGVLCSHRIMFLRCRLYISKDMQSSFVVCSCRCGVLSGHCWMLCVAVTIWTRLNVVKVTCPWTFCVFCCRRKYIWQDACACIAIARTANTTQTNGICTAALVYSPTHTAHLKLGMTVKSMAQC